MPTVETIEHRVEQILQKVKHIDSLQVDGPVCKEIQSRIDAIGRFLIENKNFNESGSSLQSHIQNGNHLALEMILFNLDRCEELLQHPYSTDQNPRDKEICKEWLCPTVRESLVDNFFCSLVNIRGRLLGYKTGSATFSILDVLYVRSPLWLEPILRLFLKRIKPERSELPRRDVAS